MSYTAMSDMLKHAIKNGFAVGAFNVTGEITARACIAAAENLRAPLILQTSMSVVKEFGARALISLLRPMAASAAVPVAIHLDHCRDEKMVMDAVDLGWSSVMYDGSRLSFEENIRATKRIADYAAAKGVTVEGEVGAIVGVEDSIYVNGSESALATVDGCREFVSYTRVSALAPAIGTAHGLYVSEPNIRYGLLRDIAKSVNVPLVVHGGTGLNETEFKKLVAAGAAKINISTAIKIAYCRAMGEYTEKNVGESDPIKLDAFCFENVKKTVSDHITIFGAADKLPKQIKEYHL